MADFGTELSCTRDIDPNGSMTTGPRVVAEALYRRLITPRGRVIDDPNYGSDISQFVNDDTTKQSLVGVQAAVISECIKEERVLLVTCNVVLLNSMMTVTIKFTTADGPFTLVVSASQTSVTLLSVT